MQQRAEPAYHMHQLHQLASIAAHQHFYQVKTIGSAWCSVGIKFTLSDVSDIVTSCVSPTHRIECLSDVWVDVGVNSFGHDIQLRQAIVTSGSTIMITPTTLISFLSCSHMPTNSWALVKHRTESKEKIYDSVHRQPCVRLSPRTLWVYSSVS